MKIILRFIVIILCVSFTSAQNLWQIKTDSANFAILISDYKTYELEKGYFSVHEPNTNTENKLPIESIYNQPSDYGDITFLYSVNSDTLFSGEIIWQGVGSIIFPRKFIPADSFLITQPSDSEPISFEYFNRTFEIDDTTFKIKADSVWDSVRKLDIVNAFSQYPYQVGIFLYMPGSGVEVDTLVFSDFVEAKWIIFLYTSADKNITQKYLPLKKGNKWLFEVNSCTGFPPLDSCGIEGKREVIVPNDSTMPNGQKYFFISGILIGDYNWVRLDSTNLYVYDEYNNEEKLFIDLKAEIDSYIYFTDEDYPRTAIIKRDTTTIFGEESETIHFGYDTGIDYVQTITLSDKFGFIYVGHSYYQAWDDYSLLGCVINDSTFGTITAVKEPTQYLPNQFELSQNYPNPFNPTTIISFTIPSVVDAKFASTTLKIYDVLGNEVTTLVNGKLNPGNYKVEFNASNLSSGIYFYRIITAEFAETKKMILLK